MEARSSLSGASLLLPTRRSGAGLLRNFRRMCLLFSVNHGCVTAVLNLSVVLLGNKGSYMSGALYVMYAATALVASSAIVAQLGARGALCVGSGLYCVYIVSFPLALIAKDDSTQLALALSGGSLGGVAAGFLWAAQGSYFATSARLYAEATGTAPEAATSSFAATFGTLYLGMELLLKTFPLALKAIASAATHHAPANASLPSPPPAPPASPSTGGTPAIHPVDLAVAIAYSGIAIASVCGMATIWDIDGLRKDASADSLSDGASAAESSATAGGAGGGGRAGSQDKPRPKCTLERLAAAVLLWCKQPTVLLLAPIQITFGVCAALLGYEVTGRVVKVAFPDNAVVAAGLLSALVALVAGLLQWPFKQAASAVGKPPLMLIGLCAFGGLGVLCLLLDDDALAHVPILVSCYLLQAVGRACFEGTNKALYADFFPQDADAAFSNIVLANGLASAIAYFTYPELPREVEASVAIGAAGVAVLCYLAAEAMHRKSTVVPLS